MGRGPAAAGGHFAPRCPVRDALGVGHSLHGCSSPAGRVGGDEGTWLWGNPPAGWLLHLAANVSTEEGLGAAPTHTAWLQRPSLWGGRFCCAQPWRIQEVRMPWATPKHGTAPGAASWDSVGWELLRSAQVAGCSHEPQAWGRGRVLWPPPALLIHPSPGRIQQAHQL